MDKNKKKANRYLYALGGLVVLTISFAGGWLGSMSHQNIGTESLVQQRTILKNEANVISDIASQVGPSVVSVNVTSQSSTSTNPYYYLFGYGSDSSTQESAGTGVILNKDGLVLTNRHVVPSGTTEVSVTLSDGTVLEDVKVIGRTSESDSLDVAFLKIGDKKGHTLTPATVGDSSLMKVGDSVVAIGNTLGQFQNTVTSGIISGYGRSIQASSDDSGASSSTESLDGLFQTDAAINEGNSGGPLVNLAGEVVGINTAIASDSQNVGFAIPINDIIGLIRSVEETGKLERPYLGVRYVLLTDDIAKEYNLKVSRGAYIPQETSRSGDTVVSGGPADRAGIEPGDVITKIDSTTIDEKTSLTSILGKHRVGDSVKITVQRGDEVKTMSVILSAADTN
jgi:serine protease Do